MDPYDEIGWLPKMKLGGSEKRNFASGANEPGDEKDPRRIQGSSRELSLGGTSPDHGRGDGALSGNSRRQSALQDPGYDGRTDLWPDQGESEDPWLHAARKESLPSREEVNLCDPQPTEDPATCSGSEEIGLIASSS